MKKSIKRIMVTALAIVFAVSLTACAGKTTKSGEDKVERFALDQKTLPKI